MSDRDPRIDLAEKLFAAWSSGDADRPGQYLAPHAVLYDIVGGRHEGWPAIRAFFAQGLKPWADLALIPDEYWTNERGVALRWVMSATIQDDALGAQNKGKKWRSEGMSYLVIENGRVTEEVDYHDSGAVAKSLGA